jgi:hypothetical protein
MRDRRQCLQQIVSATASAAKKWPDRAKRNMGSPFGFTEIGYWFVDDCEEELGNAARCVVGRI